MAGEYPGIGVMIQALGGNEESVEAFTKAKGRVITALSLGDDDALHFVFDDGFKMRMSDQGQSCCESRYMRTDDKLEDYVGATLLNAMTESAPDVADDGESHEVEFLRVETSKGTFTMSSHNEHNGYYGGFWVIASEEA